MKAALSELRQQDGVQPIDLHFAQWMRRQAEHDDPATADAIETVSLLVGAARSRGDACTGLDELDSAVRAAVLESVAGSPLISDGTASPTPLVRREERFWLWRFWDGERRLAEQMLERIREPSVLRSGPVADLFPNDGDTLDWQAVAACAATMSRLTVVLGGPGTGKTTTVARVLALLLRSQSLRVLLTAPTGKAAARLADSIRGQRDRFDTAIAERLPTSASTLHRALEYLPHDDRFRRHRGRPLEADVVIVDEASMIDLPMFVALFEALPPTASVILLGDPDQLASVGAGHVLGDLRAAARPEVGLGPRLAARVVDELGDRIGAEAHRQDNDLAESVVQLRRSYRFEAQIGIGRVAHAVRDGDAKLARQVLDSDRHKDAVRVGSALVKNDRIAGLNLVLADLEATAAATTPDTFLEHFDRWQVLCAVKEGPEGVSAWTRAIERWIASRYDTDQVGRPILITQNDARIDLYNGDVGVLMRDASGQLGAFFREGTGVRKLAPARLPAFETAWTITVHKSQGSEYERVILVLPERETPVASRQLVYTGITRAKSQAVVIASPSAFDRAVAREGARASGLAQRLSGT